jgi:hypothetical protein
VFTRNRDTADRVVSVFLGMRYLRLNPGLEMTSPSVHCFCVAVCSDVRTEIWRCAAPLFRESYCIHEKGKALLVTGSGGP